MARPPEDYGADFVRGQRKGFLDSLRKGCFAHNGDIAKDSAFADNTEAGTTASVYQFFIPLNEIFPQLKEFPDGLIYIGLG